VWLRINLTEPRADDSPGALWRIPPTELSIEDRLGYSISALRSKEPDLVADRPLSRRQQQALLVMGCGLAVLLVVYLKFTLIGILLVVNVVYIAALLVRVYLFRLALRSGGLIQVSDEMAREWPDDQLPRYSVLVPAFRESEVFSRLVANLRALEYPPDKLEILLLLEADDEPTIAAARLAVGGERDVVIVLVPAAEPRTKPKALNFGLTVATGEIITIYDAEDRPDPLQLRKAAIALATAGSDLACVQAKLDFFNPHQNILTSWFTLEYNMWFNELLPGLSQLDAPIPLGGTSNHFRRKALLELGAWDPFNVTEDADLGIRLHRLGYRSGVLDSVTFEEANSDFINWVKQRSRWYKGYAQTLLVHLRHPVRLYRELGFRSFLIMSLFVGGTPLLALLNPIFWTLTAIYFIGKPHAITELFPVVPYFLGLASLVIGNFLVFWSWLLSARDSRDRQILAALLSPLYWVMMGMAAVKAGLQLVTAPSFWEKTQHGLDHEAADDELEAAVNQ
jgi:cellulose synthase/poly-beta-1,6-N-acetylglucosamine synthase-like glycosyltransferase